jgi:hypothetical protein
MLFFFHASWVLSPDFYEYVQLETHIKPLALGKEIIALEDGSERRFAKLMFKKPKKYRSLSVVVHKQELDRLCKSM